MRKFQGNLSSTLKVFEENDFVEPFQKENSIFENKLSNEDALEMIRIVSDSEIKNEMFEIEDSKALGNGVNGEAMVGKKLGANEFMEDLNGDCFPTLQIEGVNEKTKNICIIETSSLVKLVNDVADNMHRFGLEDMFVNDKGIFFFKFHEEEGMNENNGNKVADRKFGQYGKEAEKKQTFGKFIYREKGNGGYNENNGNNKEKWIEGEGNKEKCNAGNVVVKIPNAVNTSKRAFKFSNFITEKIEFLPIVKEERVKNIKGHTMYKVVKKMKLLKAKLKQSCWKNENVFTRVVNLKGKLNESQKEVDQNPQSE
nr:hypothetical protein [Tanacetum cinerariifolium]